MNKAQLKERSIMLVSYAMMNEGFRLLDLDPMKVNLSKFEDNLDMKLILMYKKLHKLNKIFTTEKIARFLDTRLKRLDDNLQQDCQPLYIGLLALYLYLKVDIKRDLYINDLNIKDIEKIFIEHHKEFGISKCTIDKAVDIFNIIYPDENGFTFFLKTTDRFPFNLIKE